MNPETQTKRAVCVSTHRWASCPEHMIRIIIHRQVAGFFPCQIGLLPTLPPACRPGNLIFKLSSNPGQHSRLRSWRKRPRDDSLLPHAVRNASLPHEWPSIIDPTGRRRSLGAATHSDSHVISVGCVRGVPRGAISAAAVVCR